MLTLVTGGAASGKSAYAENLALSYGQAEMIYLATMQPFDQECVQKIAKHRQQRQGKGFTTMTCYTHLAQITVPDQAVILLDCLSNLLANEMYAPEGNGELAVENILQGVKNLRRQGRHLVIVTNEIFSDGIIYDESNQRYLANLGSLNNQIAQLADQVVEIVYTLPLWLKKGAENS